MKKLVPIFIPCYNEGASLLKLYEEIGKLIDAKLLFVNDDCRDKTMDIS